MSSEVFSFDEVADIQNRSERLRSAVDAAQGPAVVARRAGMPLPTLSNYLQGRDMKASALVRLARAANVSVQWLATGEGDAADRFTPKPDAIFDISTLAGHAHFWGLFVSIRSCQDWFKRMGHVPTLLDVLIWIRAPYEKALPLPDRPIEFKSPGDSQ